MRWGALVIVAILLLASGMAFAAAAPPTVGQPKPQCQVGGTNCFCGWNPNKCTPGKFCEKTSMNCLPACAHGTTVNNCMCFPPGGGSPYVLWYGTCGTPSTPSCGVGDTNCKCGYNPNLCTPGKYCETTSMNCLPACAHNGQYVNNCMCFPAGSGNPYILWWGKCPGTCGASGQACCSSKQVCNSGLSCQSGVCQSGASCGANGQSCCAPGNTCGSGLTCQSGVCATPPCGATGQACCSGTTCSVGNICSSGTCSACGSSGQSCCTGNSCNSGNICSSGTCNSCGALGQACCLGNSCSGALTCSSGTCQDLPPPPPLCGDTGQACCAPGNTCNVGLTCQAGSCQPPCGATGQTCCGGTSCNVGNVCSSGTCQLCGAPSQLCCAGNSCIINGTHPFNTCNIPLQVCQVCGGAQQICCGGAGCIPGLTCSAGLCQ